MDIKSDKKKEVISPQNMTFQKVNIRFGEFIVLMAMMMSLTALAIDAMLPALSIIGTDLGVKNANDNQLIISSLFFGLAIGQLFYGPLSDSKGRKLPLYWGLIVFLIGSVISICSTSLVLMLTGRVIQGFGLASPRTVSLAMIRDQFEGREMARVMSFVMMIFIFVPIIAPSLGQLILLISNWKTIFISFILMAILILLWFSLRMHETLPKDKRVPFSFNRIFKAVSEIFHNRIAMTYMLTAGFISSPFIAFLNSSQQIFQVQYNLGKQFPLYFAFIALTVGVASFFNGKMVIIYGMQKMIKSAVFTLVLIALFFLIITSQISGDVSLWMTMLYLVMTIFCIGILFGNLNSLAMQPLGHIAGIGSAIIGAISTFISVSFGTLISMQYNGTVFPLVIGFLVFGSISMCLIFWVESKR
ncbi:MAG: multidrug effflux MFS transporter [Saprospiraceae bacterium]|nr:multidrug effflux MFS transporter [Saprospiraceae bacterium]